MLHPYVSNFFCWVSFFQRVNVQNDFTLMESSTLAPTRIRKQQHTRSLANWTPEEDALLHKLVTESTSFVSWSMLASFFPNKTAAQLSGRWDKVINPKLVKGSWTTEEDETIIQFVQENGDKDWAKLALLLKGRTGKQCRERYRNHLDKSVKHTPWTKEEDDLLARLHAEYGNAWTKIAEFIEGRTDNCIKNRWNSTIKKRLERMESGQPLVMKRGRKPKVVVQHEDSSCSSPVEPAPQNPVPTIEIIPLTLASRARVFPQLPFPSLEQNRLELQKLLLNQSAA